VIFHSEMTSSNVAHSFARNLSKRARTIPVSSSHIGVLTRPDEFYSLLIDSISKAQHRISLSSLYLGTGSQEKDIIAALDAACNRSPDLCCNFIFDYHRGTRGGLDDSTLSLLLPLARKHPNNVNISFFRLGQKTRLLDKLTAHLPERYNEMLGTFHLKSYVFDDSTLLSGANLSQDYFTNRQVLLVWYC
jgi:CDP-diacylglycerol--glycerol-3-phosphate 3-phosphatidyltransferase